MLEIRAIVVQVRERDAIVQVLSSGCGQCSSNGGCGSGTLSKLFCGSEPRQFRVANEARANVGDEVEVSLPDGVLLRGALRMYVLPLLLLLVGGIFGVSLASTVLHRDAYSVVGAVVGLSLGLLLARVAPFKGGRAVVSSVVVRRSSLQVIDSQEAEHIC